MQTKSLRRADPSPELHLPQLNIGRDRERRSRALLNPSCGVTLNVAVAVIPETMLKVEGFAATVKVGRGGGGGLLYRQDVRTIGGEVLISGISRDHNCQSRRRSYRRLRWRSEEAAKQ